ncbi:MAG: NAD(P)-dependent malic enzyme [Candidatus Muiribacteriota bacterium]
MSIKKNDIIKYHKNGPGKIETRLKTPINSREELSLAYTPGVAEVCKNIYKEPEKVYDLTSKGNTVAILSDGSALLGLGNLGPEPSIPVMEGKAALFKKFANIDAWPICVKSSLNTQELAFMIKNISPGFGGINLEDVASPRCFEVEDELSDLNVPYFHDDQQGTAVVVLAGIINSLKITKKNASDLKVVINGAGAAGVSIAELLDYYGVENIVLCDKEGVLKNDNVYHFRKNKMICKNIESVSGKLEDALKGADIFIGVSAGNVLKADSIKKMNNKSVVFALANPEPEINPLTALEAGAFIVATGRSDYPNQINNLLGFPGIFRGALDSRVNRITRKMCISASRALADVLPEKFLNNNIIIPDVFDKNVVKNIAIKVAETAIDEGVSYYSKNHKKKVRNKILLNLSK